MDQSTTPDITTEPTGSLDLSATSAEPTGSTVIAPSALSRAAKAIRIAGWTGFALFCLLLFTLMNLPEQRLKNYIQGTLSSMLSSQGITFTAGESKLSFLFGVTYRMKNVTLLPPPPEPPVKVDEISVSPSILPLLLGRVGGSFRVENGDGSLKGSFSMKGQNEISVSFKSDKLDLGKLAVFPMATGMKGGLVLSGKGSLSGDLSTPSSWNGDLALEIKKLVLEQQSIKGFGLPRLTISESQLETSIDKGKATIGKLQIGKPGSSDDITATVTGDVVLGRQLESSLLNLKARFTLSQNVTKSSGLIEMLLAAGKQTDGSFAYNLSGPLLAPNPTPVRPQ